MGGGLTARGGSPVADQLERATGKRIAAFDPKGEMAARRGASEPSSTRLDLLYAVAWTWIIACLTKRRPYAEAVAGDAEVMASLTTLAGRADLTGLVSWAANAAAGAERAGTQWLDGDLGYIIAVTGSMCRETSGDDGRLTAIFTGQRHEGAAGRRARFDLTAAFGGSR